MITQAHIQKFKELYFKRYGFESTEEEILEAATKLVELLAVVYKPIKKGELPPPYGPP